MQTINVRPIEGDNAYLISTNETVLVVDRNFVLEHGGRPLGGVINALEIEPIHEFVGVEIGDKIPSLKSIGSVPAGTVAVTDKGKFLKFAAGIWVDIESRNQVAEGYDILVVRVGYRND